jgi:DsbC/DsbD-like thiol-disulfide interchange protein
MKRTMNKQNLFFVIMFLLILNNSAFTQSVSPDKVVDVKVITPHAVSSQGLADVEVVLNIKKGWHLNANKPFDKNLSPTVLSFKETAGIQVLKITYPEPSIGKLQFSESQLALYEDNVIIKIQLKVNKKTGSQPLKLEGEVKYQPCNNETCLFPAAKSFTINLSSKKAK